MKAKFDISLADSQATVVKPINIDAFDFSEYKAYADELDEKCKTFWESDSGVMVYRRMRVAECFSYGCRDMKNSLELQLGALKTSLQYRADVPNFLEPWYGIGTIASAFGGEYIWHLGNAPALKPKFSSLQEILEYESTPVAKTAIGKHTLEMIAYFMELTRGEIPISLTDTQSPLNMIGHFYPIDDFFMDMILSPDKVIQLLDKLADLSIEFNNEQLKLVGDALASPGHGFASSRTWTGLGMSDDNAIMISPEQYMEIAVPSVKKICDKLGGVAFHSCGNWEQWIDAVLSIKGVLVADGAFSEETDPDPNTAIEEFQNFANSGIILHTRIVGGLDVIEEKVKRLWVPGMKLIVVTYCKTPEEQGKAYNLIHKLCK